LGLGESNTILVFIFEYIAVVVVVVAVFVVVVVVSHQQEVDVATDLAQADHAARQLLADVVKLPDLGHKVLNDQKTE
jgi:uncharacterized membrane protein